MKRVVVVIPLLFAPGAASPAAGAEALPQGLSGIWALELSDCSDEGAADFRIEITETEVAFAASAWSVRGWKRSNGVWQGSAQVSEEGYAAASPRRRAIALQLMGDGTLKIDRQGQPSAVYHRCAGRLTRN